MSDTLEVFTVFVTARTTWVFFRLSSLSGESGIGEATVHGHVEETLTAIPTAIQAFNNCKLGLGAKLDSIRAALPVSVSQAITSGLEQTWLDRLGKASDKPLYSILGGHYRDSVPTYANVNRGTVTRTPAEFAQRALSAVDSGYTAVKMAPFDDIKPEICTPHAEAERSILFAKALDRVAAVAEQISERAELQVDCHSRLRVSEVIKTMDQMADLGVSWFEEPVSETAENVENIAAFRKHANGKGILLVGAENSPNLSAMSMLLGARCYDVVMPDIILAGGPTEVLRIGHFASSMDCAVSLHNPCGPVMDIVSAHVAAALPRLHSLERQYDESPLYDEVIEREHVVCGGLYRLSAIPGVGCALVDSHPMVKQVATYSIDL